MIDDKTLDEWERSVSKAVCHSPQGQEFIQVARTALPTLIAEVRRLRGGWRFTREAGVHAQGSPLPRHGTWAITHDNEHGFAFLDGVQLVRRVAEIVGVDLNSTVDSTDE